MGVVGKIPDKITIRPHKKKTTFKYIPTYLNKSINTNLDLHLKIQQCLENFICLSWFEFEQN